ncbi:hypothetical protein Ndes2526B_g08893 [Nannochloris sp. 'desiccata']|nr:hypothetical protein KSW81_001547 [Chlorella desiccata (nom. nud.)]KAH7616787.1 putative SET and MYND domain-containing protein 4 [Chlorella desiccata (nom. nud.)]
MEVLLKSITLYTNQEEIQKLQSQPNAEELVAEQISAVINELASELLTSVATELSSPNVYGCVKDFDKSEELRTSGNALFSRGKYLEAVQQFSKSLALLNCSNSSSALEAETCAKVLCNRALCLSKLKLHKLAEFDSTEAISIKPDHAKAFYRRSIASLHQNNISSAIIDAERAVRLLKDQDASAEEAEALLASLLEKCSMNSNSTDNVGGGGAAEEEPTWTTHSVPQDLWNEKPDENNKNTADSAASVRIAWSCSLSEISKFTETRLMDQSSIKLTESARLGRHLIVGTHEIEGNNDIIKDQPVAHALEKYQRLRRCGHCCQELPLGGAYFWPCRACCVVLFCSKECRDHGNVHHVEGGPECGVPWTVLLPPEVVLAVRLACRLKRDQERDMYINDNIGATTSNSSSKVVSSLETCFSKMDTEEAIWRATTACAAHAAYTIAYQRSNCFADSTIIPITIAEVLRALGIVHLNGIAIVPPAFGSEADSIGIGVYPVASFLSHSCIPNVSVRFQGNTAIIRALSTLSAGASLFHSYGPQAGEMTTAQRRMMLKDQYHFFCECDACAVRSGGTGTDKIEIEKEAEMVGLKCTTEVCLGAMPVPVCSTSATGSDGAAVPGSTIIDAGICSKYDLSIEDEHRTLKNNMGVVGCTKCGAELPEVEWNSKIAPRLAKASKCYSTSCGMLEAAEKGEKCTTKDIKMAVAVLKESLKIRQELLHRYNQVVGATHSALSWVEEEGFIATVAKKDANKKNKKEAGKRESSNIILHSRASLEIAERVFPHDSTNIAFERLKLGTLLQENGSKDDVKQGKNLVSAAITTLERYFGSEAAAIVAAEEK